MHYNIFQDLLYKGKIMKEIKHSHIMLRGPDGQMYALRAKDLEQFKVDEDVPELDEFDDELQAVQLLAFKVDEDGNANPKGNSCAFLVALFSAVHEKPEQNEKMTYVNLDFNMNSLTDD